MNRIEQIYKEIEELKNEIKLIQDNCNHTKYIIGLYSWRIGSSDLKRICTDCNKVLNQPTDIEIFTYQEEMKISQNKGIGSKIYTNS